MPQLNHAFLENQEPITKDHAVAHTTSNFQVKICHQLVLRFNTVCFQLNSFSKRKLVQPPVISTTTLNASLF